MNPTGLDNAVRGRFNAWFFDALEGYMHWKYAQIKSSLLVDVPPVVVELGPGAGANLRYLPRGIRLIAVEPNRHFHPVLRRRARQRGIDLDLRNLTAEALDLPTASVDFIFTSLVLCSVTDPEAVLREVRRVLKPGCMASIAHLATYLKQSNIFETEQAATCNCSTTSAQYTSRKGDFRQCTRRPAIRAASRRTRVTWQP